MCSGCVLVEKRNLPVTFWVQRWIMMRAICKQVSSDKDNIVLVETCRVHFGISAAFSEICIQLTLL